MSFQIELDKYESAYGHFIANIQAAIQKTFEEEEEARGLTQAELARELAVDPSVVSRRLNGTGNITLRTISDLFTGMGREPLSNFETPPKMHVINTLNNAANCVMTNINVRIFVINNQAQQYTSLEPNTWFNNVSMMEFSVQGSYFELCRQNLLSINNLLGAE